MVGLVKNESSFWVSKSMGIDTRLESGVCQQWHGGRDLRNPYFKTELFYKNFMIYIKAFIKEFFNTLKWWLDPSTVSGLICNFIFHLSAAIILFIQGQVLLAFGFLCGCLNGFLNYRYNTEKKNFLWFILALINTIIIFGILLAYFIIYVI